MNKETIGIISGLIIILSVLPYLLRTFQRKIQPDLVSWGVWAVIGLSLLLTYRSSGATTNIWAAVFGFLNPLLVVIVAFWRGERRKPNLLEITCLSIGLVSILLWFFVNQDKELSKYALFIGIFADACGAIPTIAFVWRNPDKDRPFAWLAFSIASFLNMFAIENQSVSNYALPVYMMLGSGFVAIPLVLHRLKNRLKWSEWI